jgi:hypothetical protein
MQQPQEPSPDQSDWSPTISRRRFNEALLLGAGTLAAGAILLIPANPATAAATYLSTFDQQRYYTYPHQNGFFDGGRQVVLGQMGSAGRASLWVHDIPAGTSRKIADFVLPGTRNHVYYDVAENRPVLAASDITALWTVDLAQAVPMLRKLYTPPPGNSLDDIVSINADASTILAAYRPSGANYPTTVVRVGAGDGRATLLFTKNFRANHLQYSPNDPSWFGFARDQGNINRVWGCHPIAAPQGKLLWNQKSPTGGDLRVGHEVWCRHDLSLVVVAYQSSPGTPPGLYQVWPDGRSRLVQAADNYVHCNISRDGRYAVVDTTTGGVVLVDMAGKASPRELADTRIAPHPRHPHPRFTPDGSQIIFTDTNASNQTRVAMVAVA